MAIIEIHPKNHVWAIDRDPSAISRASRLVSMYNGRFQAVKASFKEIVSVFDKDQTFDAIMFDLGMSSDQVSDKLKK